MPKGLVLLMPSRLVGKCGTTGPTMHKSNSQDIFDAQHFPLAMPEKADVPRDRLSMNLSAAVVGFAAGFSSCRIT